VRAAPLQREVDQKGIAIPADRCSGRSCLHCASQVAFTCAYGVMFMAAPAADQIDSASGSR